MDIDISSKPLKNKLIEVNTSLKFQNKTQADKKSYFVSLLGFMSTFPIRKDIIEKYNNKWNH